MVKITDHRALSRTHEPPYLVHCACGQTFPWIRGAACDRGYLTARDLFPDAPPGDYERHLADVLPLRGRAECPYCDFAEESIEVARHLMFAHPEGVSS